MECCKGFVAVAPSGEFAIEYFHTIPAALDVDIPKNIKTWCQSSIFAAFFLEVHRKFLDTLLCVGHS